MAKIVARSTAAVNRRLPPRTAGTGGTAPPGPSAPVGRGAGGTRADHPQPIDCHRWPGEDGGIRGRHRPSSSPDREEVSSMERYEDLEGSAVGLINAVIN
ncbi:MULTISPECIES: hypothetical protein [unclassified Micromonospora]|uniref:hypothetical protein n=1 Tax=unclassified Micromonospora TaxID=2617518 RepID=UPI001184448A|nr:MULTISPECIES: hypothetical protein [unclassified Micromonospora]MDI5939143.1 hypothetical protein [Micromonospora sp. DH15]